MDIFKERIPCTNGEDVRCNTLEVKVYYDLGGYNYFTYQPKKRGYYVSVSPLEVNGNFVSYQGFSGTYMLLNEVKRQSKKGEEEALKLFDEKKQIVIGYICNKHGIKLIA
jgi:hypothetical protein